MGSSDSFVDSVFVTHSPIIPITLVSLIIEHVIVDLQCIFYKKSKLLVIQKLCTNELIGHDIIKLQC